MGYLCFTAGEAGSFVTLTKVGSPSWTGYYSTDGSSWSEYVPGTTGAITLANAGDKVYFKGTLSAVQTSSDYIHFSIGGSIAGSGNIMSLCSGDNYENVTTIPYAYCFYGLFIGGHLTTAPELPATTLTGCCYRRTFMNCTDLVSAPVLPATTLANNCYNQMFYGCTSLTTAPNLPATTLATMCYYGMFTNCTSLTTAPALPATTLTETCYGNMFYGCTSLTTPPILPATTLASYCYSYMFRGCTNLQISDTQTSVAPYIWRIPSSGTFTNTTTYNQPDMFANCLGTRSSDTMSGAQGESHTYYTQSTVSYKTNKVVYNNKVLLDLTADTVIPSVLVSGYTAHDLTGTLITGTAVLSTPTEIDTDAGMTAVLTAANVGKVYKFTGTTGTYTNGDLYEVTN